MPNPFVERANPYIQAAARKARARAEHRRAVALSHVAALSALLERMDTPEGKERIAGRLEEAREAARETARSRK